MRRRSGLGTRTGWRLVLSERMTRPQMWGFLAAMTATVLIAAG